MWKAFACALLKGHGADVRLCAHRVLLLRHHDVDLFLAHMLCPSCPSNPHQDLFKLLEEHSSDVLGDMQHASKLLLQISLRVGHARFALRDAPPQGGSPAKDLLLLDLQQTHISAVVRGSNCNAQLTVQDVQLFDCCSDPGVSECIMQRLSPGGPLAAHIARVRSEHGGSTMAAAAAAAQMPLLTLGLDLSAESQHVSVQLQPLQLLARPACVAAVAGVVQRLPFDGTLAAQLQLVQRQIGAVADELPPDSVAAWLPPLLATTSLAVTINEVVVLLPTQLSYAEHPHVVLCLGGLRLQPQQQQAAYVPTAPGASTELCLMGSPTASEGEAAAADAAPGTPAPPPPQLPHKQQYRQYSAHLRTVQLLLVDPGSSPAQGGGVSVLQLPPLAASMSLLASGADAAAALVRIRLQLPMLELKLRSSQLALLQRVVSAAVQHATPPAVAADIDAAADVCGSEPSRPCTPTELEVERWLTSHALPSSARGAVAASLADSTGYAAVGEAQAGSPTRMHRADSDQLLHSSALEPHGAAASQGSSGDSDAAGSVAASHAGSECHWEQLQTPAERAPGPEWRTRSAGAPAAMPRGLLPLVALLDAELQLESLQLTYVQEQEAVSVGAAAAVTSLQWQLQAQTARLGFAASTRGCSASVELQAACLRDQVAAPPSGLVPGRLFRQLLIESCELSWQRMAALEAVRSHTQAALLGLQLVVSDFALLAAFAGVSTRQAMPCMEVSLRGAIARHLAIVVFTHSPPQTSSVCRATLASAPTSYTLVSTMLQLPCARPTATPRHTLRYWRAAPTPLLRLHPPAHAARRAPVTCRCHLCSLQRQRRRCCLWSWTAWP